MWKEGLGKDFRLRQSGDGWTHVTSMSWAKKIITASDKTDELRQRTNCGRSSNRGCSLDDSGNQGPGFSSTDEEDTQFQWLRIKRRRSLSKGDDKEAFWSAGPKSEIECQKDLEIPLVGCSVAVLQPMKQSHSEASNRLTSPPSHRKPQLWPLATSHFGIPEPSAAAAAAPCITTQDTDRLPKGFKSPDFPVVSDSLDSPFYVAPGSPSPHESSNTW